MLHAMPLLVIEVGQCGCQLVTPTPAPTPTLTVALGAALAMALATIRPAGPPPRTATSNLRGGVC